VRNLRLEPYQDLWSRAWHSNKYLEVPFFNPKPRLVIFSGLLSNSARPSLLCGLLLQVLMGWCFFYHRKRVHLYASVMSRHAGTERPARAAKLYLTVDPSAEAGMVNIAPGAGEDGGYGRALTAPFPDHLVRFSPTTGLSHFSLNQFCSALRLSSVFGR